MNSLLSDWIELFDDKNFESLKNVPQELKSVTMLFVTLQKEFKTLEISLNKKVQMFQSSFETKRNLIKKSDLESIEVLEIQSSPSKENMYDESRNIIKEDTKTLPKSPTFSRHRKKLNLKKINRSFNQNFSSYVSPQRSSNTVYTSKNLASINTACSDTIADDDILDCSIIAITPNVNVVKKTRSKLHSPRKKLKSLKETTLTQIFSEMATRIDSTKDETSMMGIEEIINKIDNAKFASPHKTKHIIENSSHLNISENIKVSSFVADYDKIPDLPNSPKKKFVYKETVRGNEKKKLKGWSCKECENFYKCLKLPEKELEKKMDECSKHRSRFKPDEETMPGYWDLSIRPTPEDQKTQTTSPNNQESIGNDSSIFCFYKN